MKEKHKLTNINKEEKTAVCSICGPVGIKWTPAMKNAACKTRIHKNNAEYKFKKKYGIKKPEEYTGKGTCEICKQERVLVYDHDHDTGKFRGYICNRCNTLLGFSYDNTNTLANAIRYLQK